MKLSVVVLTFVASAVLSLGLSSEAECDSNTDDTASDVASALQVKKKEEGSMAARVKAFLKESEGTEITPGCSRSLCDLPHDCHLLSLCSGCRGCEGVTVIIDDTSPGNDDGDDTVHVSHSSYGGSYSPRRRYGSYGSDHGSYGRGFDLQQVKQKENPAASAGDGHHPSSALQVERKEEGSMAARVKAFLKESEGTEITPGCSRSLCDLPHDCHLLSLCSGCRGCEGVTVVIDDTSPGNDDGDDTVHVSHSSYGGSYSPRRRYGSYGSYHGSYGRGFDLQQVKQKENFAASAGDGHHPSSALQVEKKEEGSMAARVKAFLKESEGTEITPGCSRSLCDLPHDCHLLSLCSGCRGCEGVTVVIDDTSPGNDDGDDSVHVSHSSYGGSYSPPRRHGSYGSYQGSYGGYERDD